VLLRSVGAMASDESLTVALSELRRRGVRVNVSASLDATAALPQRSVHCSLGTGEPRESKLLQTVLAQLAVHSPAFCTQLVALCDAATDAHAEGRTLEDRLQRAQRRAAAAMALAETAAQVAFQSAADAEDAQAEADALAAQLALRPEEVAEVDELTARLQGVEVSAVLPSVPQALAAVPSAPRRVGLIYSADMELHKGPSRRALRAHAAHACACRTRACLFLMYQRC
jgi:hypothetical protein